MIETLSTASTSLVAGIVSGALIISAVFTLVLCACCKPRVPQHKAKVVKNVVAEEEIKINTLKRTEFKKQRPSSIIYDGTIVGRGRWDDLTQINENDILSGPVKNGDKKQDQPLNPPDVILPVQRKKRRQGNGKRPKSMFVGGAQADPPPTHPQVIATSFEDLVRQNEEAAVKEKTPGTPLKEFTSQAVTEKSESGSIVYYRSRKHIDKANQSETSRDPRDRIKSSGYPFSSHQQGEFPTQRVPLNTANLREFNKLQSSAEKNKSSHSEKSLAEYKRSSGEWDNVPKSVEGLSQYNRRSGEWDKVPESKAGLPEFIQTGKEWGNESESKMVLPTYNRLSGEWDNVPNAPIEESPPPVPVRRYLDTDIERGVSQSDWSDDMPRPRISEPIVESKIYAHENSAPGRQRDPSPKIKTRSPSPQPHRDPSPILPARSPSPKPRYRQEDSRNDREYLSRDWSPGRRHEPAITPGSDSVFSHGSDNLAYIRDAPPFPVPTRDYRNVPMHPDVRRYRRGNESQHDRQSDEYYPAIEDRRRQSRPNRRRRVDDTIQENGVPLGNYDPNRPQLIPGVYLRSKPYYRGREEQEGRKRYSDASDYSDILYNRRSHLSDRPVHPRDIDPYFFRSRWSMAPDSAYDVSNRRNSDFNSEEYVRELQKQHYRRSLMQDIRYESDIVRGFPRSDIERNGRLSSGYQSQVSKPHDSLPDVLHLTKSSPPPQISLEHYPSTPPLVQWVTSPPQADTMYGPPSHPPPPLPKHVYNSDTPSSSRSASSSLQSSKGAKIYRQMSNEYGDLIDVLYKYKQNVQNTRQKEMPSESPESRLKFEREKLKLKLTNELGPEHRQSKNLDMIIEALLYLCETKNKTKKRSRKNGNLVGQQPQRPNSITFLPSTNTNKENDYSLATDDVRADVTRDSNREIESQQSSSKYPRPLEMKRQRRHDYYEINLPRTAPVESSKKEFAFPSVDEVNRILAESDPKPPALPPRKHELKNTPQETSDAKTITNPIEANKSDEKVKELSDDEDEVPDNTEANKSHRRRSLPSMHFSESELLWLSKTGDDVSKPPESTRKFEQHKPRKIKPKYKSTRERTDSTRYAIPPGRKMAGFKISEIDIENEAEKINLDDIVINDKTDAEDIVSQVERRMSEQDATPIKHNTRHSSPYNIKHTITSDSDMGTWSSIASSELPPTAPRRVRLHRSEGKYPSSDNTPMGSPVAMRFSTPPPKDTDTPPPLPVRKESLSPIAVQRALFQTPPPTPRSKLFNPLNRRASSAQNVSAMRQHPPSPRVQATSKHTISSHFSSKKQPDFRRKSVSPAIHGNSSSAPTTPYIVPKTPPVRTPSRAVPKLPFMGRKFDKSTKIESPKATKHFSRTGEVITLPDDSVYAVPFDCIVAGNKSQQSSAANGRYSSPISPKNFRISENSRFFPIRENFVPSNEADYDYAVPINSPPTSLVKQKKLSKSTENILRGLETAV